MKSPDLRPIITPFYLFQALLGIIISFTATLPIWIGILILWIGQFLFMPKELIVSLKGYRIRKFKYLPCTIICSSVIFFIKFLREIQQNVEHRFCQNLEEDTETHIHKHK